MAQRTWLILASDGRHVTASRTEEPTTAELHEFAVSLRQLGVGGWLAVMEGRYHGNKEVTLTRLAVLGEPANTFEVAVYAFKELRNATRYVGRE